MSITNLSGREFFFFELSVFEALEGKLGNFSEQAEMEKYIESIIKAQRPATTKDEVSRIISDAKSFFPIDKYLVDEEVEDIMINNTRNIFVYHSSQGDVKVPETLTDRNDLELFVKKLRMYATTASSKKNIFDVHLPNGSRANIVDSPLGSDITIRNFKNKAFSVIDLINHGELSYSIAARFWLYAEGLKIRPANMLIGGTPASGKTTMLNALFSFFRPDQRIIVIEDTYELNTDTQENCVRLETSPDLTTKELVKNSLRMRPDMIIIGEVRAEEAEDMMTAMNIGKIVISTLHASTSRDVVTRLEHEPMNINKEIIPLIDSIILVSRINQNNIYQRKVTQISEISGIETQVLLSDLYLYDYKTRKGSEILPSITYRDTLSKLTGYPPSEIIREEYRRAKILQKLNEMGIRDIKGINEFCRIYYEDQERALNKIGLKGLGTLPW
jgi:flagellar protein FlaI